MDYPSKFTVDCSRKIIYNQFNNRWVDFQLFKPLYPMATYMGLNPEEGDGHEDVPLLVDTHVFPLFSNFLTTIGPMSPTFDAHGHLVFPNTSFKRCSSRVIT